MSRPRDRLTMGGNTYRSAVEWHGFAVLLANTAKQITLCERGWSSERVKYLLHVFVLLELVDKREDFRGLLFGQLGRHGADVFVLG